MVKLTRYWTTFDFSSEDERKKAPNGIGRGCGITAFSEEDAIFLLEETIFKGKIIPKIKAIYPNIDITTLDENHIRPNMGTVSVRGVWFPKGFDWL